jgi:hypothetical protein
MDTAEMDEVVCVVKVILRVMEGSLLWLHLSLKSCQHGSGDWHIIAAMMGHGGAWKGCAGSWMHLG